MKWLATTGALAAVLALMTPGHADPGALQNPPPAEDAAAVRGEVVVLHGTNSGKGVDARIKHLKEQLEQPPFSMFDSYELLTENKVPLTKAKASDVKLPDEGKLALTLEGQKGKKVVVQADISKADGEAVMSVKVNATPDKYFFLAGQKFKDGILVLGIRIVSK
jgi:hypothetical protein